MYFAFLSCASQFSQNRISAVFGKCFWLKLVFFAYFCASILFIMAQHNKLGKEGEQAACEFLIARGYTVRETNWRMGKLEIDIVAQEPGANRLHIVEVKTRSSIEHFDPMESITRAKIRNLVAAANGYIQFYQLKMSVQYDVMILVGKEPDFTIHFIPNAFQPPLRTIR